VKLIHIVLMLQCVCVCMWGGGGYHNISLSRSSLIITTIISLTLLITWQPHCTSLGITGDSTVIDMPCDHTTTGIDEGPTFVGTTGSVYRFVWNTSFACAGSAPQSS
jgi:hypothetical protein